MASRFYEPFTIGSSPVQLIEIDDPPTIIQNLDTLNTLTLGSDSGVSPDRSGSFPLQPGGSVTLDGSVCPTYGICPIGQTASVIKIPGGLNFAPGPATIAAILSASGISLLANPKAVFNITSPVALPTNGSQQFITPLGSVNMGNNNPGVYVGNFLGYEFSLVTTCNTAETSGTFTLVQVDFFENQTDTVPIDSIRWYVSAATAGKTSYGKGPMRGQYMQISMFNGTTAALSQSLTSMRWNGSGRSYQRDDWRDINSGNVTTGGFKQTAGDMQRNQVFADQSLLNGAGTVLNRLGNNWAGRTKLFLNVLGLTTKQVLFQLQEAAGLGGQVERVFLGDAATQIFEAEYILARVPYLMTFTNSSGVAATISYSLVAQDY